MDKNVLEAKIKNGKWVKQPQEPKLIFSLANDGEMQPKTLGKKPTYRSSQKRNSQPEEKEEMTAHMR